ncbi:MAG TPA: type II toxin-antitoxin system VapC family toxin [Anaerolineae bacterium]
MNIFYMDSSAIVKRYVMEAGSEWILRLCEGRNSESIEQSNLVMVAEITLVEVAAAIARRAIKTKELGVSEGSNLYKLFVEHFEGEYRVIALTPALVRAAADMAQKHALRAYDAVQLACAVHAASRLRTDNLALVFVSADFNLLQAARAEGMATENPFDHRDLDTPR